MQADLRLYCSHMAKKGFLMTWLVYIKFYIIAALNENQTICVSHFHVRTVFGWKGEEQLLTLLLIKDKQVPKGNYIQ